MNLKDIKVQIPQKDFATASEDYLRGFQAGADAALSAVANISIDGLPTITNEQGLAMRTGQPTPNETLQDKTERNFRVQSRYDALMREGKHGHYETMFRVVREEIERQRL